AVVVEDVGKIGRDDAADAVIQQRPGRVLARGPAAEILVRDDDLRLAKRLLVQHEIRVLRAVLGKAQRIEQMHAQPRALDRLQEARRDDLIGVDVLHRHRRGDSGERGELVHGVSLRQPSCLTSVRCPVTAAAAAMDGETRCVRPLGPCRPSKLRFDVLAQRWPGVSLSGFMPRHMEQHGSRHSNPASSRIRSSPSSSAWRFTRPEPGTTKACTPAATLRPLATAAAARMSSIRPLVQLPMKTTSTGTSWSFWPGFSAMYSSMRCICVRLPSSASSDGFGTVPVTGITAPGVVPQVIMGAMSAVLSETRVS